MSRITRRNFVKMAGATAAVGAIGTPHLALSSGKKVVVIGGGYGGAIAAKYIRMADPSIEVTLIEKEKAYVSCPLSNPVLIGIRDIKAQTWGYDGLKKHGINVVHDIATAVDPKGKTVKTKGGHSFSYDRLVVSPGVTYKWGAIEGYDEAASHIMPHAWKAGPQTVKLGKQLRALKDGEPFIIVAPPNPFRCPPGPYERASLAAYYFQKHKPKSKVIILDPKESHSKKGLFQEGWKKLYGFGTDDSLIEWVSKPDGGTVVRADPKTNTVYTDMDEFQSSCINIIPPQKAGHIAHVAGLVDKSGWCPVDYKTFESKLHKDVHVIGDAGKIKGLPKSGYAANSEAKVAAAAIVNSLKGAAVGEPSYVNTCYSLIALDYGISVSLVSKLKDGAITKVAKGLSPSNASAAIRKQEAQYAEGWYQSIMSDMFS